MLTYRFACPQDISLLAELQISVIEDRLRGQSYPDSIRTDHLHTTQRALQFVFSCGQLTLLNQYQNKPVGYITHYQEDDSDWRIGEFYTKSVIHTQTAQKLRVGFGLMQKMITSLPEDCQAIHVQSLPHSKTKQAYYRMGFIDNEIRGSNFMIMPHNHIMQWRDNMKAQRKQRVHNCTLPF
jgi:hypothetical protein